METINNIELGDENIYPDESVLQGVLGESYGAYLELLALFERNGLTHEWRYYRDGKAWLCKVQKKKKTIVWMSAWRGYMQAVVYLPVRLIDNVYAMDIAEDRKQKIRDTKCVGKSKPCIFEVYTADVLEDLEKVMHYKMTAR